MPSLNLVHTKMCVMQVQTRENIVNLLEHLVLEVSCISKGRIADVALNYKYLVIPQTDDNFFVVVICLWYSKYLQQVRAIS